MNRTAKCLVSGVRVARNGALRHGFSRESTALAAISPVISSAEYLDLLRYGIFQLCSNQSTNDLQSERADGFVKRGDRIGISGVNATQGFIECELRSLSHVLVQSVTMQGLFVGAWESNMRMFLLKMGKLEYGI